MGFATIKKDNVAALAQNVNHQTVIDILISGAANQIFAAMQNADDNNVHWFYSTKLIRRLLKNSICLTSLDGNGEGMQYQHITQTTVSVSLAISPMFIFAEMVLKESI